MAVVGVEGKAQQASHAALSNSSFGAHRGLIFDCE
jgi:hypothetical protein